MDNERIPGFYSVLEAAEFLGLNPETIRRLIREKKLNARKYSGYYISLTALRRYGKQA